jgi:hypothetical protein
MKTRHTTAAVFAATMLCILLAAGALYAGPPQKKQNDAAAADGAPTAPKPHDSVDQAGYRIEQPGTITFTVGMVIKGKLEKPQVMIFLPKERTFYREQKFTHSFTDDLSEPLPFSPILE